MQFKAEIHVTLKRAVNDPQGLLEAESRDEAESAVDGMCDKLLANPVIEDYHYDVAAVETSVEEATT